MKSWTLLLFFLLISFLYLLPTGRRDLWEPDEPRHALMSQEVLDRGVHLFQTLDGAHDPNYGPLYFWLAALVSLPEGKVTDATALLPSILAALGILVSLYFFGKELGGARFGFLAAAVLAATPNFLWQAQSALIDMLLALPVLLALFVFYRATLGKDRPAASLCGLFAALALGWLTKGPISFVLVFLAAVIFLAFRGDRAALRSWLLRFAVIGFVLAGIWYGAAYAFVGYDLFWDLFWKQTMGRFLTQPVHPQPFYYFLLHFPAQFLPWTLFLVLACVSEGRRLRDDPRFLLPAIWFVTIFVFFSLASGKRRDYLLPLFPAAALLAACGIEKALAAAEKTRLRQLGRAAGILVLALLAVGGVLAGPILRDAQPELAAAVRGLDGALVPAAGIGIWFLFRGELGRGIGVILATLTLGSSLYCYRAFPALNAQRSWRPFIEELSARVPQDAALVFYRCYRSSFVWHGGELAKEGRADSPGELRDLLAKRDGRLVLLVRDEELDDIENFVSGKTPFFRSSIRGREHLAYLIE